jgi:hypothetical protein
VASPTRESVDHRDPVEHLSFDELRHDIRSSILLQNSFQTDSRDGHVDQAMEHLQGLEQTLARTARSLARGDQLDTGKTVTRALISSIFEGEYLGLARRVWSERVIKYDDCQRLREIALLTVALFLAGDIITKPLRVPDHAIRRAAGGA